MKYSSLEEAEAAARNIMQTWIDAGVWPEDDSYHIGRDWLLRLKVVAGENWAMLFELDQNGNVIRRSGKFLPLAGGPAK